MRAFKKLCLLCLMTLLLTLWLNCCASLAAKGDAEILRVPSGWTSHAPGYWLSDGAARDIVSGWSADRESVKVLRQGIEDLKAEVDAANADTRRLIDELRAEIQAEREEYARKIRAGKRQGILIGLLIGAVGGVVAGR